MPTKCVARNCTAPAISSGACDKHRKRLERHGHLETTRPTDWGSREKHPFYRAWCGLRRYHKKSLCLEWDADFWAFVRDAPAKPGGKTFAARARQNEPWGPDNFYWKEPILPDGRRAENASKMRAWQRSARAADPDYGRGKELKKLYGVTLEWWKETFAKQNGVCLICLQPETAMIRGKVLSLAVDHCHDTGRVRGLLCRACNNAIGALKHDPEILNRAISYLKGPSHGQ